jgi:hypothetical protein
MTDRIFKQYAQGYGSTPCQVLCQIDGDTVFDGPVATVDAPRPSLPDVEVDIDNVAWTWSQNASFDGTRSLSIAVSGSSLVLARTLANNPITGGDEEFGSFYLIEINGVSNFDPLTDVAINGVAVSKPHTDLVGQWWWLIPAESTFTATLHVDTIPPLADLETPE